MFKHMQDIEQANAPLEKHLLLNLLSVEVESCRQTKVVIEPATGCPPARRDDAEVCNQQRSVAENCFTQILLEKQRSGNIWIRCHSLRQRNQSLKWRNRSWRQRTARRPTKWRRWGGDTVTSEKIWFKNRKQCQAWDLSESWNIYLAYP